MPSKNMLPKGKRRQTVRAEYRVARTAATEAAEQARAKQDADLFGEVDMPEAAASHEAADAPETSTSPRKGRAPLQQTPRQAGKARPSKLAARGRLGRDEEIGQLEETSGAEDELLPISPPMVSSNGHGSTRTLLVDAASRGLRLDQFLARALPAISRARVQLLIEHSQVHVDGAPGRSKSKLLGGETVVVEGEPQPAPLKAIPEDIPLTIVYEDKHLAIIDKPAGMMVHAGSGLSEDARSRSTLVNALLHHYRNHLSALGGPLRPGIVHRLDKQTSGLILVAKNDAAHHALANMFSERSLEKRYIALVHRALQQDRGTILLPIGRDRIRRTRMTTRTGNSYMTTASHGAEGLRHPNEPEPRVASRGQRGAFEGRSATTHYTVMERLHTSVGNFTLLDVRIETGRTHQIRVHMQALGHPVVGDTLYGAPARIPGLEKALVTEESAKESPTLARNFLHAAHLAFKHPVTGKSLKVEAALPAELALLLERLRMLRL